MKNKVILEKENKIDLLSESLQKAFTYSEYRSLVETNATNGTSTGPNQSEALSNYTLLNHSRMKRLDKTIKISEEVQEKFRNFTGDHTWLVITESWCGDAAHSMPAMNALANIAPGIDFKVVLRDENPILINAFQFNGTLSIPRLIALNNTSQEIVDVWGPRPSIATQMVEEFKTEFGALTSQFKQDLQLWYNKDKMANIIADLANLID